jgi:hypothetical protein
LPEQRLGSASGCPVESRMLGNGHVRFGGRVGETDRRQRRHRAPARPDHPCTITLIDRARSVRVVPERRCKRQRRISHPSCLRASSLTAGTKPTNTSPALFRDSRGRNVYPKKSNDTCS